MNIQFVNKDSILKMDRFSNDQEVLQERPKQTWDGEKKISLKSITKLWETKLFLLSLCLPLSLQVFFYPGVSSGYRIVVISLQLIPVLTGIICLSPLHLEMSTKVKVFLLLWLGWGWVCAINSAYPMASCVRQIEWTVLILFTGMMTAVLRKKPSFVYWAYGMLVTGFVLVAIGIVVYWNLLPDPKNYDWVRMMPHFANIRNWGHYAAAMTIMSSIGAVSLTNQWDEVRLRGLQLILIGIQTMAFGFLFWSGGRGSVIAVLSGFLWLLFFGVKKNKKWLFVLLTSFSASIGFVFSSFFVVQSMSLGLLNMLGRTLGASTLDRLLSGRLGLWEMALKLINPPEGSLLFGYGPDAFRMYPDTLHHIVQPHNVIIQAVLDWGIPGAFFFCILLFFIYTSCYTRAKKIKKNKFEMIHGPILGSQALLIGFLLLGFVDGVFYHALPLTILSVSVAIIFAYIPFSKQDL